MATVTDYASLSQAIQDFEARSDISTYVDYFIQRAEEDIYNDIFTLNEGRGIAALENTFTGIITNNTLALPTNYLGLRYATVTVASATIPLQRRTVEFIYQNYPLQSGQGVPAFIGRSGTNFVFGPYADSQYTVSGVYWERMTALSAGNTTTWMTSDIPSTLLSACMRAVGEFEQSPDKFAAWDARYQRGIASFVARCKAEDYSGSELMMQVG